MEFMEKEGAAGAGRQPVAFFRSFHVCFGLAYRLKELRSYDPHWQGSDPRADRLYLRADQLLYGERRKRLHVFALLTRTRLVDATRGG